MTQDLRTQGPIPSPHPVNASKATIQREVHAGLCGAWEGGSLEDEFSIWGSVTVTSSLWQSEGHHQMTWSVCLRWGWGSYGNIWGDTGGVDTGG